MFLPLWRVFYAIVVYCLILQGLTKLGLIKSK